MKNRNKEQKIQHIKYMTKYNRIYYNKFKYEELNRVQDYQYELKQIAFFIYSNGMMKCNKCGFDDFDCLDIDHINNNGCEHRHKNPNISKSFYVYLQKFGYPVDYQVLCKNCNWKKHICNTYDKKIELRRKK